MGDPSNEDWGEPRVRARSGILASGLAVCARALEAESDRWFLWLPVFFAASSLTSP